MVRKITNQLRGRNWYTVALHGSLTSTWSSRKRPRGRTEWILSPPLYKTRQLLIASAQFCQSFVNASEFLSTQLR